MTAPALASSAPPRLLALAGPLFVELLLFFAVGIVGTAFAARLSDDAGAAFALAMHVFGALFIFFRIVGAGVSVVVTQALGAGRRDRADALARAALGAGSAIGGALALITLALHRPLLGLLSPAPALLALAAPLLVVLAPTMLLDAWISSMTAVLRAHLRARDTLAVMTAMQIVHLALLAPAMFGVGEWPGFGIAGFGVALMVSRALTFGVLLWLWRERLEVAVRTADFLRWRRDEVAALARIGGPGAAETIAYRLCFTASVGVAGSFGATALATHAYTQQVMMVVLLFGLATGLAAEVLVGRMIGAGKLREAHALVKRSLARGLAVSVIVAAAAAATGTWLMRLFTNDPRIVADAVVLLWWTVLLEPGRTFNLVVINALRAAGDVRYPVAVGAVSMLLVLAGGSWLLGSVLGLGLVGVWIAYAADEWLRGLLMWRRWARLAWVPHAKAARRQLLPA